MRNKMLPKKLFIIDCLALAYRSYFAYPKLTTSDGRLTGVVYGSSSFLSSMISTQNPDYVIACTDPGTKTFRHDMYPEYKANRKEKDAEFVQQLPDFYKLLEKMKIPLLRQDGFEADDLIGSLAKKFASDDLKVYIVSPDKDFMQCVNPNVFLYKAKKWPEFEIIDTMGVVEKMGVGPAQIVDMLAIMGDAADNVPGVKGIGEKGAAKLVKSLGSVESIYENLHAVPPGKMLQSLVTSRDAALLSKKLVTIKTDIDLATELDSMVRHKGPNEELKEFYKELQFNLDSERFNG